MGSPSLDEDIDELSNEELLKRVAKLDPKMYPIAERAEQALDRQEGSS